MTRLAMGAAVRPPVASLPALPPSSTTTATAIWRSPDPVKPMNQACGFRPWACWAVPVLPATSRPGILALTPVPLSTTWRIMSRRPPAAVGDGRGHRGHLERGDADVALADGALGGGGHVLLLGDRAGRRRELVGAGLVEAELLGLAGQLLAAQLEPEGGEGG